MLADSELDVDKGLESLVDKSLITLQKSIVEMHCLVEDMGKEIVRAKSQDPGEREFLTDPTNVRDVLEDSTGTNKVVGISLDINEIDELRIDKQAFKVMRNLKFLNIYANTFGQKKNIRWHLPEGFDYLPRKLKFLCWEHYPLRYMPCNFQHENLVTLQMRDSNLEKLWEGVQSLTGLRTMDMWGSKNLKEIPNLSMATNLETLDLGACSSLVEVPSSIQYLNKLIELNMSYCDSLEILPTGMNLKSLCSLRIRECPRLKSFPDISSNISNLDIGETAIEEFPSYLRLENLTVLQMFRMKSENLWNKVQPLTPLMSMLSPSLTVLWLSDIPSLVELPSSFQNLHKLKRLTITECKHLETLPNGINFQSLDELTLTGCSHLRTFPYISTNISRLCLDETGIEEVPWWVEDFSKLPWWVEDFSKLQYFNMFNCNSLQCISVNICKLKHLKIANFPYCEALTEATKMNDSPNEVVTENIHFNEDYYSTSCIPKLKLNFRNSFNFDPEAFLHQQSVSMEIVSPGEEVPSYFTYRTSGPPSSSSLNNIPMPHTYPSSQPFFRIRTCLVVDYSGTIVPYTAFELFCRFKGRLGNHFDSTYEKECLWIDQNASHMFIVDCLLPLDKERDPTGEVKYDTVDVKFRLIGGCRLKGWGVRLSEGFETYQFGDSDDSDIGGSEAELEDSETDQSEENDYSDISNETYQSDYSDTSYETEDSGGNDVETKRRRIT